MISHLLHEMAAQRKTKLRNLVVCNTGLNSRSARFPAKRQRAAAEAGFFEPMRDVVCHGHLLSVAP
jgi:hypothetical protein